MMSANCPLAFSAAEEGLFSELVVQTITALRLDRGRRSPAQAARFAIGDFVGGQSDMSCDQQIYVMLECAEIIDHQLHFKLTDDALPAHLANGARFGVDLLWAFEGFLNTTAEWHPDGWEHPLFSYDPFEMPPELISLGDAFAEAGYLSRTKARYRWTTKAKPTLGLICWGYTTERGLETRHELKRIFASLPDQLKDRITTDRSCNLHAELEDVLSNHWYNDQWNDGPVRGSRDRVHLRGEMNERASIILTLFR